MNELKPEDVMRALECCEHIQCQGEHCPYHPLDRCREQLRHDCYALLREKDAEIERLKKLHEGFTTKFKAELKEKINETLL